MVVRTRRKVLRALRLNRVYEAALTVAKEVTPEAVLQRIADLACEIIPARYAALGVADESGRITQFITSGVTDEDRMAIGSPPEGRGLLGEMIRERTPLLVPDIAKDPRSVGFPSRHPPMRSLMGVPILLGDQVLGNLYLTERLDGEPFDDEDLEALHVLATHAAAAIDRAQAYRRAEQQRDQLRIILDNLPSAVLIMAAPDGRIEEANATAVEMIFGAPFPLDALPVYGRDLSFKWPDGTPLRQDQRLAIRALRGETPRNQQLIVETADRRTVPVLAQAAPLQTNDVIERAVLVLQDITQLREAEQLKDDFLSLVSHEFRTPLTAIHGGAHLLREQGAVLDEETRRELLGDIVAESDRLERMLTNILTLTAAMAGRLEVSTEPLLVGPLARTAAAEAAALAPRHEFRVEVPTAVPPAEGDPALLGQVLRNLYENAVKYSPAGGEVVTSASCDGRRVTIEVADSGIGIAPDQVDQVFTRFHRVGMDPTVRGMGLGLYLCRYLVEAQGGALTAHSSGPGRGATFAVTLPVARGWADGDRG